MRIFFIFFYPSVEYGTVSMFTLTTVWVLFCIDLINSNIVKYYYNF